MTTLSYTAEQVRRWDHDRFLTAIFAPAGIREHLFALYAFNLEIAKTSEVVSEPLIGQIRLQWWRDALDRLVTGGDIAHEVARPLGVAIRTFGLPRAAFDRLIDAREFDLDRRPPVDMAALLAYAEATGAAVLEMALNISRSPEDDPAGFAAPARLVGTAWAMTGLLRAVPFHARQRRLYLPEDLMSVANVNAGRLYDLKPDPGLSTIVRAIAEHAALFLDQARPLIRAIRPPSRSPLLLAPLARLYLNDLRRTQWDPFMLERLPARNLLAARLAVNAATGKF